MEVINMTIWCPQLPKSKSKPLFKAIADAIESDIDAGVLGDGDRLPTQRELSVRLDTTVVTVTKAYKEAKERGLINSVVGRGSFITKRSSRAEIEGTGDVDLCWNFIATEKIEVNPRLLKKLSARLNDHRLFPAAGTRRDRSAGATWLSQWGRPTQPEDVIVTAGVQHGLTVLFQTLCKPGDVILTESVTYPGVINLAHTLGIRLYGIAMDREGIIPAELEKVIKSTGATILYCMPRLQNPTGATMSPERVEEIAQIVSRNNLFVIEDDVYGFLLSERSPTISSFLPNDSCYLAGMSKSFSPSIRVGYIAAPPRLVPQLSANIASTIWFTSTIASEVATELIEGTEVDKLVKRKRETVERRQQMAERIFQNEYSGYRFSPHLWLKLSNDWRSVDFVEQAKKRRIIVAGTSSFTVPSHVPTEEAIRVCLGAVESTQHLNAALLTLKELLCQAPSKLQLIL